MHFGRFSFLYYDSRTFGHSEGGVHLLRYFRLGFRIGYHEVKDLQTVIEWL
jgi:hypothetical protein